MYSVNNKSQETTEEFYVMGSSRDNGRIKISQPKRVANQKIRTKNKQEHAGIRGGGSPKEAIVSVVSHYFDDSRINRCIFCPFCVNFRGY